MVENPQNVWWENPAPENVPIMAVFTEVYIIKANFSQKIKSICILRCIIYVLHTAPHRFLVYLSSSRN